MTTHGYYRYPTIYKANVVFVCEDDLWMVPARGGEARRLTANLGRASHPAFSPDGKLLAFVGREEGQPEVYVMPARGGPATRLTYLGGAQVLGWTPQGQIVFSSDAGQPFRRLTMLYTIDPAGGEPRPLDYGPARSIAFGPEGGVAIGRRAYELANWKRYRGGTAGDIWIDRAGQGEFEPLIDLESNLINPLWLGDRIYFLSDHEGVGNLYSCTPQGQELRRHTNHNDYYVRQPATDGERFVYRAGADLYIFNPDQEAEEKEAVRLLKIRFYGPRVQRNRKFVKGSAYFEHFAIHPAGHSLAMQVRGKAFTFSNWDGAVIQHGQPQGVRYRLAQWLNDGKRLIMVSDAAGEERLEIHPDGLHAPAPAEVERLDDLAFGRAVGLKVSPRRDQVALTNHRYELLMVDLADKSLKVLDQSHHGRIAGLDWSPDGAWIAYGFRTSRYTAAIKLVNVESGETHFVTPPKNLYDVVPQFDPGGKYLYFISYREFDPVSDSHYFDLNFPRGGRPYLATLQQSLPDPFASLPNHTQSQSKKKNNDNGNDNGKDKNNDEDEATPAPKNGQTEKAEEKSEGKPEKSEAVKAAQGIQIDLEGIQNRVVAFPVSEGRYRQVRGLFKNKVLFTSFPVEGNLNRSWRNKNNDNKGTLELYDLTEQKKEHVVNGISSFDVSRDRKYITYRSAKNLRVLKAGEKPDNNATGYNKKSGWVQLNRLRVAVNPPEEWRQMFREAWRLQRDHFWSEDMSRLDWEEVYRRYYPLIDRVASRSEFSDLLWEMQGELGTSHAYELGGDYRTPPRYRQGFLGADFVYDPEHEGYRITHIVQGDSWQEKFDSPLNRLGANLQVGDILLAIDGERLSREFSPQQALVNRANTEVQLTLLSPIQAEAEADEKNEAGEEEKEESENKAENEDQKEPAAADDADDEAKETVQKETETEPQTRTVLVKTLTDETRARYREWVETNRRRVHQATEGRVGYVHIPDMGAFGYAEFHRYYRAESEREGLIVDVRFNGGGNVSQLLLEKLSRRRVGFQKPRYGQAASYPAHTVPGPLVALTNEYAGSDGDIFSHVFKLLELGPLIGKRTWGGVIGIWPRHSLVDGTITTQPEFSFWFEDVGWSVENYGTEPDIEIDIRPQDYAAGEDPQLDRALTEIMTLLEENPPAPPEFDPPPSRALPQLPDFNAASE